MKQLSLAALSLGVLASLAAGPAGAQQYQSPTSRPAISPWLNLLRGGATQGENYYNLVRPQFDFGAGINQLQSQTLANRSAISGLEGGLAGYTTGHRTGFMTQSRYFMNNSSGAAGGGRGGVTAGSGRSFAGPQFSSSGQGAGQGVGQGYGAASGLPR